MKTRSLPSALVCADGHRLALRDWPLAPGQTPRALVLLVHGLGEHVGRYEHVALRLNAWGFAVRGYDQYGHGASEGPRGGLASDKGLLTDLAEVVDATRSLTGASMPLILLGHSLGGLVVARFVSLAIRPVQGLVMSSPALDPGLNAMQKVLLAVLPPLVPNLRVGNGLDPTLISHDAATVAAYLADKLVHDRIAARLARFIAEGGAATLALAAGWSVPTLLLYAGADKLVNPAGSRSFAAAAPPAVASAHCFESLYHEIFNETDPEPVFTELQNWLSARF